MNCAQGLTKRACQSQQAGTLYRRKGSRRRSRRRGSCAEIGAPGVCNGGLAFGGAVFVDCFGGVQWVGKAVGREESVAVHALDFREATAMIEKNPVSCGINGELKKLGRMVVRGPGETECMVKHERYFAVFVSGGLHQLMHVWIPCVGDPLTSRYERSISSCCCGHSIQGSPDCGISMVSGSISRSRPDGDPKRGLIEEIVSVLCCDGGKVGRRRTRCVLPGLLLPAFDNRILLPL